MMKGGEIDKNEMMKRLEERIREKLEKPTRSIVTFVTRNGIHFVNQNIESIVQFFSGPAKFTIGWLDGIDKLIRQHLTQQGMLMKQGMATSRLHVKPDAMGMGLKSCVGVYMLDLVRILQCKWEPSSGVSGSGGWKN